ncbi:MAG: hypothetical protein JW985_02590 [Alphaproteobacteria bacterium]|nr:hypothetical protein [Alphaproteobacteria bacterium]
MKILEDIKKIELPTVIQKLNNNDVVFLFNLKDAIKFLIFCDENNIGLLGYDGFRIIDNKLQPDLSFIGESKELVSGEIIKKALLQESKNRPDEMKDMYFEFVLKEIL